MSGPLQPAGDCPICQQPLTGPPLAHFEQRHQEVTDPIREAVGFAKLCATENPTAVDFVMQMPAAALRELAIALGGLLWGFIDPDGPEGM